MTNEELISGLHTVAALPNLMGPAAGWCKLALDAIETLTRERDEAREALEQIRDQDALHAMDVRCKCTDTTKLWEARLIATAALSKEPTS